MKVKELIPVVERINYLKHTIHCLETRIMYFDYRQTEAINNAQKDLDNYKQELNDLLNKDIN